MRGLDPHPSSSEKSFFAKVMDCRVKPGNDKNLLLAVRRSTDVKSAWNS
jgi:hypothetical protein